MPTPDAPAWTRTSSPFFTSPRSTKAWKATRLMSTHLWLEHRPREGREQCSEHSGQRCTSKRTMTLVRCPFPQAWNRLRDARRTCEKNLWYARRLSPAEVRWLSDKIPVRSHYVLGVCALMKWEGSQCIYAVSYSRMRSSGTELTPPVRPRTSSPSRQSETPSPTSTIRPENSTPRIVE